MAKSQSAALDRKKLMADPVMVGTIVVLITFLTLFILYPLAILLVDSFYGGEGFTLATFQKVMAMPTFRTAIGNTLKVGRSTSRCGNSWADCSRWYPCCPWCRPPLCSPCP